MVDIKKLENQVSEWMGVSLTECSVKYPVVEIIDMVCDAKRNLVNGDYDAGIFKGDLDKELRDLEEARVSLLELYK